MVQDQLWKWDPVVLAEGPCPWWTKGPWLKCWRPEVPGECAPAPPPQLSVSWPDSPVWIGVTELGQEVSVLGLGSTGSVLELAAVELLQSVARWEWPVLVPLEDGPRTGLHITFLLTWLSRDLSWSSGVHFLSQLVRLCQSQREEEAWVSAEKHLEVSLLCVQLCYWELWWLNHLTHHADEAWWAEHPEHGCSLQHTRSLWFRSTHGSVSVLQQQACRELRPPSAGERHDDVTEIHNQSRTTAAEAPPSAVESNGWDRNSGLLAQV